MSIRQLCRELSGQVAHYGFDLSPEGVRYYLRRGCPPRLTPLLRRCYESAHQTSKRQCARCLYSVAGLKPKRIAEKLCANESVIRLAVIGLVRPTRIEESHEYKRRKRNEIQRAKRGEWRKNNPPEPRKKPGKRKITGRECAKCLFAVGFGGVWISRRVPLSATTLLRTVRPPNAVARAVKPPVNHNVSDFGRDCAACLFKFGFGVKAVKAILPVTRRRVRRWKKEIGVPPATRDPYRLSRIGKKAAYYDSVNQRLAEALRGRINAAISGNSKAASSKELLGCSIPEARKHLESMFKRGMAWENYGEWHIDHITPCAAFDLSKPGHQRICFHFRNLQPLWASENMSKNDRIVNHQAILAI